MPQVSAPTQAAAAGRVQEILARIRRIEIRTRKVVEELTAGAYHSVFKGRGMEFREVREYAEGDDVRAIDWNVTARFGRPFVKQFAEERELVVMLVVDVSASGDFGSTGRRKNEVAAELAATLAFSAIRNGDRVGLLLHSTREELYVPPRKGRRHVLRLIRDLLYHDRRHPGTNLRAALENLLRLQRRKAVVFLISDMLDAGFGHTLAVAARRHDVTGLRIIDPKELSGDKIVFGATVTLLDEDEKPIRYQIVGQTEADAKGGRISYNSPLGRALIGRKVDDEIEVSVPAGDRYYLVSKIEFI